ncbi:DUF6932 family protein [Spirosoma rhododendri]|uniref:Uncharacterized protein n=1 Tax=Spirosoma rhododendri TaxID=2728024 RepID=A0A7L5DKB9_9BACT|nr:hypothetical protein [Spirosoma rhododendri]QJD77613.1 hypothetical protein HH216_03670 [Spirosoma rhododendri]
MDFDASGYLLPHNILTSDVFTLEQVFVLGLSESTTRRALFERYLQYNDTLRQLIPAGFRQWVDGSFISRKLNPRDIDFLTFVDYQLYENHESAFDELRRIRLDRSFGIDGYFVKVYPNTHRLYNDYQSDLIEWQYQFGTTRKHESKGFLEITI